MSVQLIAQQRAKFALERVKQLTEDTHSLDADNLSELRSRANDLPALVHRNGLGQAMAFYRAKDREAHRALYVIANDWLCGEGQPYAGQRDLLSAITTSDATTYRAAQAELQSLLVWVKQFVRAFVAEPKEHDTQNANVDSN